MNRGFTIVETLASILVLSIIMIALSLVLFIGQRSWSTGDATTELRQNILLAIMPMTAELRQTTPSKTNIGSGAAANSITFQIPNDNNGDGTVIDSNGNIEWSTNITYAVNASGILQRTQGAAVTILSHNISALQFSRPAGDDRIMQIDITAQKNDNQGITRQDIEQAILKMRN